MMRNVWTIGRRDFTSYFTSPIAYIIISGFMLIMGWMFVSNLSYFNAQNMQYQQFQMNKGLSITEGIVRPFFSNLNLIFLFLVPFITMRLFSEEKKSHTIELLMTAPISLWDMILGKFFSSFLLISIMLGLTGIYVAILFATGNPEIGPIFTCYLGTLLFVSCYLSIGILFSSVTENQIVAGALSFAAGLFFWLLSWATQMAGPVLGDVLDYLCLFKHFNQFSQGVLDTTDVFYYLSFIGVGLFLTHRVLDSFRWR